MTTRTTVAENIDAAASGINDSVHEFIREAKPMLNQAAERAQEFAHKSLNAASKAKHDFEDSARDLTSHASHMIRNEPFKAMLVAAGVGAAVAALIGLLVRPHSNQRDH